MLLSALCPSGADGRRKGAVCASSCASQAAAQYCGGRRRRWVRRYLGTRVALPPKASFGGGPATSSPASLWLLVHEQVKCHLEKVLPLEELPAAHELCEKGHVRGRIGICINKLE